MTPSDTTTDHAVDALLGQRRRILQLKLEVYAVEIVERLRLRAKNLESILTEELQLGSQTANLPKATTDPETFALERLLRQQQFDLNGQRRREDVDCWRDLVGVMEHFLTTFEAHEQAKARGRFLGENAPQPPPYNLPDHDLYNHHPSGPSTSHPPQSRQPHLLHGREKSPREKDR